MTRIPVHLGFDETQLPIGFAEIQPDGEMIIKIPPGLLVNNIRTLAKIGDLRAISLSMSYIQAELAEGET